MTAMRRRNKERYPRLWKGVKLAAEILIIFVGCYISGYVGLKTILGGNGLFLWNFWFGSIYSFVASDSAQTLIADRNMKKYAKYQFLRLGFFIGGIYISAEASLSYMATFNAFISSPSTLPYVGYWVWGLSAGAFVVPYLYFRWKYRKQPMEVASPPEPPVVLEGL